MSWQEWVGVLFEAQIPLMLPGNVPVTPGDVFELGPRELAPVAMGGSGLRPDMWLKTGAVVLWTPPSEGVGPVADPPPEGVEPVADPPPESAEPVAEPPAPRGKRDKRGEGVSDG